MSAQSVTHIKSSYTILEYVGIHHARILVARVFVLSVFNTFCGMV